MKSIDTNIFLYATNADARENEAARSFLSLADANQFIIADQVYFELYRLLRNPTVLESPLSAADACDAISFYRERSGFLHCCYEADYYHDCLRYLGVGEFPARNTFDVVLAVTLRRNGVRSFYTRNSKDFEGFGWFEVINPIDTD